MHSNKSLSKLLLSKTVRLIEFLTPRNRMGDNFFSFINFLVRHGRLPSKRLIFNDVLYRIKTSNEILSPLRVFVSDKEFLKIYIKAIIGDQYNVPTIDVIRSIHDIGNYKFPVNCCIKPTHTSGNIILRKNNAPIDKKEICRWFDINFYTSGREANYKTLQPKVIIEPLIFNNINIEDYKIFCYNGKPKFIQVDLDRHLHHQRKYFNIDWIELDFSILYTRSNKVITKPKNLKEMLDITSLLSKAFTMIRIDLYSDGNEIFVGEITNIHGNASENFIPRSGELEASQILFK
jgi:hypothetical protein